MNADVETLQIVFRDQVLFTSLTGLWLPENKTLTRKLLPQLSINTEFYDYVEEALEIFQTFTEVTIGSNFVLSVLFALALNLLWSMIESMQVLTFVPLFDIRMPAIPTLVFGLLTEIAAFDYVEVGDYFEMAFDISDSDPMNQNFEALGFETNLFLYNMGSMLFGLVLTPVMLTLGCLLKLCTCFESCKKVGERIDNDYRWNSTLEIVKGMFGLAVLSACIGISNQTWSLDGDVINSLCASFTPVYLIVLPIATVILLKRKFKKLSIDKEGRYEVLYQNLRVLKSMRFSTFVVEPLYFYMRRVMLAVTVVYLQSQPFFQLQLLVWQSLIAIMILITLNPYSTKSQGRLELFNEILILLCIYHVFGMTDLISSVPAKLYLGYSLVGLLVFQFTFGIAFVLSTTVLDGFKKL